MATSSKFNHIRSISLPGRSHPTTRKVEEALNNLKTLKISTESTAETTMHDGLLGLEELYKCVNDLLNLPQILQFFSQHQHEKWVKDLLDKSMRLLDMCSAIRELILQCKENVRDLQFSLRRSKGDSTTEIIMIKFASSCKKIKKEAKKLVLALRKMDQATTEESSVFLDEDQDTIDMIKTLREANAMRISIFQMFLSLFSDPILKPKQSKRSLVSRLVNKGRISCEGQEEKMDFEVRVESFESHLDDFENGLDGLFRCMVRSRSSLLNIFSC